MGTVYRVEVIVTWHKINNEKEIRRAYQDLVWSDKERPKVKFVLPKPVLATSSED
jgi:hypothetical protein